MLNKLASRSWVTAHGPARSISARLSSKHVKPLAATRTAQRSAKIRLDEFCLLQQEGLSRNVIQSWIMQGKVLVNGHPVTKAGHFVSEKDVVLLNVEEQKYVCRAGLKLEAALDGFGVSVEGKTVLDSGLSTGGFTDCLLQRGAAQVFGVDVGYGQVAEKIRVDPRVVVMERTNLRHLCAQELPTQVDLATLDLSFISVLKVIPAVVTVMKPASELIVLIKPHFEAGKDKVGKGGVVRDPVVHQEVIGSVTEGICAQGFVLVGVMESPLKGSKGGNTEFLSYFVRGSNRGVSNGAGMIVSAGSASSTAELLKGEASDGSRCGHSDSCGDMVQGNVLAGNHESHATPS